jgi:hypothetical protein
MFELPDQQFYFVLFLILLVLLVAGISTVCLGLEALTIWLQQRRRRRLRQWWTQVKR